MTTLVFGDSIAWGAWDDKGGWVDRWKLQIIQQAMESDKANEEFVFNLGVPGDTSFDILERIKPEIVGRADDEMRIILSVGVNDAMVGLPGVPQVPLHAFKDNLSQALRIVKEFTNDIYVLTILPVDEQTVSPIPWLPSYSYSNKVIDDYNAVVKSVAQLNNCVLIDVQAAFLRQDYQQLLVDGVHPNAAGHELILKTVLDLIILKTD